MVVAKELIKDPASYIATGINCLFYTLPYVKYAFKACISVQKTVFSMLLYDSALLFPILVVKFATVFHRYYDLVPEQKHNLTFV